MNGHVRIKAARRRLERNRAQPAIGCRNLRQDEAADREAQPPDTIPINAGARRNPLDRGSERIPRRDSPENGPFALAEPWPIERQYAKSGVRQQTYLRQHADPIAVGAVSNDDSRAIL